jgi:predicted alpha/beta-hydrolase family hydrolase
MSSSLNAEAFQELTLDPPVRGFLHKPEHPNGDALILTHGAGSNAQAPLLVALAEAFSNAAWSVLRCDLPFRQAHPGPPKPGDNVRDRLGLKHAVETMRQLVHGRVFLGGQSYGGRQASMLCAEEPSLVAGLLLLSYPLHPPRYPEQLRIKHLPGLQIPILFVHGTRDPFGSIAELETALKSIPGPAKLLPIEHAGHDLGFKGKSKREELPELALSEFQNLVYAIRS